MAKNPYEIFLKNLKIYFKIDEKLLKIRQLTTIRTIENMYKHFLMKAGNLLLSSHHWVPHFEGKTITFKGEAANYK